MAAIRKIIPNLWFDSQAEEAARFYVSVFRNSSLGHIARYGKEGFEIHGQKEGTVMTVAFTLEGQDFLALNGGPLFKFTEAISFIVECETQAEIDYYWNKLTPGGDPNSQQCGWLKDKFGLSWQIVPTVMQQMATDPDPKKVDRVMKAMFPMKKLDIAELTRAYENQ